MSNFIFKSQKTSTYKKLDNKLDMIQSELRAQRVEHVSILALLHKLVVDHNLQKQVDEFFPNRDIPVDEHE